MLKRFLLIFLPALYVNVLLAQDQDLMIQGTSPGLYLVHSTAPKENWYSVGRLYNISPKEIAPFNGVTLDKPLSIGQQVKIPLTATNFSQNGNDAGDQDFKPVYHVVQEKEWMFRISTNYNKVPVENIEKWNHIGKDDAKAGTKLIVGYLRVKKDQSSLASAAAPVSSPSKNTAARSVPVSPPPDVAVQEKKTEPVLKQEDPAPVQPVPVEQKPPAAPEKTPLITNPNMSTVLGKNVSGGYFRPLYEESGKSATGASGIFKSTSGWQDGKYYALVNNVAIGTIVRLSNPANNKSIYAKVLGQLPEMKESAGLTARVSDAAASELGISAQKFTLEVKY